jgi:hypothetical protein
MMMAFEVYDYHELVRLLEEHPEWRADLRRLLLTDELLALPEIVRELVEAQRRAEERLSRVEEHLAALAEAQRRTEEAQRRTEERLSRVEEHLAALAEAQRRTEEAQRHTEERLSELASIVEKLAVQGLSLVNAQQRTNDKLGYLIGRALEGEYRDKASAYFGRLLRRVRVVEFETLRDTLEAHLSAEEVADALLVDLIVSSRPRARPEASEVYLAVEVSAVVDQKDVKRAWRRARLLQQAGYLAIPMVAGERTTLEADDEARSSQVAVLQDGRVFLWEEALQAWLAQ